MADNNVQIIFGATTDELVSGVARVKDTIAGLTGGLDDLNGKLGSVAEQFGKAFPVEGLKNCASSMAELAAVASAVKSPGNGAAIAADFLGIQTAVQNTIAAYQKLNATPINVKAGDALKAQMVEYQESMKVADDAYRLTADRLAGAAPRDLLWPGDGGPARGIGGPQESRGGCVCRQVGASA
jgi:hypothetical protein